MKQIEINPSNKPYYSKEFVMGFECGTKEQYDADRIVICRIKQVREEVAKYQSIHDSYCEHIAKGDYWEGHTPNHYESSGGKATACDFLLQILDKLIAEEERGGVDGN